MTDILILLAFLTNLKLLGSSRMYACLQATAAQGVLLAALPVVAEGGMADTRLMVTALASGLLKGALLPWLLLRAVRGADVRRELEPLVGYTLSLIAGAGMLAVSVWLAWRLPLPAGTPALLVPVAFFTLMVGLFVIIARRKAATQVLGYLAMENGIYAFGLALAHREPLVVELGILLDVFAAVFVMGITIHHINREFDSIDTGRLSALKD